ncbi:hypothetical protein JXA88_04260 [Candidatus Fermentibacteria bacterium]|nr:hypothetical protein [Candidatus Fermentibacteria bacterium]
MKRLFGWALLALAIALVFSVGGALWRSMDFDSKVSGYVQNAVRVPPHELEHRIREIAADVGVNVPPGAILILPRAAGYEVTCRYPVPLGIGGFVFIWNKEVIARTRLEGLARLAPHRVWVA